MTYTLPDINRIWRVTKQSDAYITVTEPIDWNTYSITLDVVTIGNKDSDNYDQELTSIFATDKCVTNGIVGHPSNGHLDHSYLIGSQPDTIIFPKISNGQCNIAFECHLVTRNSGLTLSDYGLTFSEPVLFQT